MGSDFARSRSFPRALSIFSKMGKTSRIAGNANLTPVFVIVFELSWEDSYLQIIRRSLPFPPAAPLAPVVKLEVGLYIAFRSPAMASPRRPLAPGAIPGSPGATRRHSARSPPCRREHIYARGYISDVMTSRCIQPSRRHGVPRAAGAAPSPGSWFFRGRFHRPGMQIPAFPLPFPFYLLKGAAGTAPGPLSPRGDGRRAGRHFKIQVILE